MELNESMYFTNVPVAIATCGCSRTLSTIFSDMVSENVNPALSGGRMRMSAPVPRERAAMSLKTPRLTPTRVRISVTSTPIAITLSRVRTGRCFRFSKTRRWINDPSYQPGLPVGLTSRPYQPRLRHHGERGDHGRFGAKDQRAHGDRGPAGGGEIGMFLFRPAAFRAG